MQSKASTSASKATASAGAKKTIRVKSSGTASSSSSIPAGMPSVTRGRQVKDVLMFTLTNADVSLANALRRTMIGSIPVPAMVGFPHAKSTIRFVKNTTRLNNEMLKSRIQCVPVHTKGVTEAAADLYSLQVHVSVKNTTENMIYVTTEDFRVYNKTTRGYLPDSVARKMFPKNDRTGMFVDLVRLHPPAVANVMQTNASTSSRSLGEELEFLADLMLVTPADDSAFNAVSTCAYSYTSDESKLKAAWALKEKTYETKEDAMRDMPDWFVLNKQRNYVPNSFDFVIETVGTHTNEEIVVRACEIIVEQMNATLEHVAAFATNRAIRPANRISENCYDVVFPDTYTIGKLLEKELFRLYFRDEPTQASPMTFCAFVKDHPQSPTSTLRLAFAEAKEYPYLLECLSAAADVCLKRVVEVSRYFTASK